MCVGDLQGLEGGQEQTDDSFTPLGQGRVTS